MVFIEHLRERIPFLNASTDIHEIHKGFSKDKKYIVHFEHGESCILRIADIEHYERKKAEFERITELQTFDVKTSHPIEIGRVDELGICYYVLSYIEGEDARDLLPSYSSKEQYEIGLEAGKDLAKIHLVKASPLYDPWYDRIMKKYTNYVEAYHSCGIKIEGDSKIIDFIAKNKRYLKNRPNCFQHDDFHIGNIIVKDKQYAGVIDFNRFGWGDPIHDFLKIGLFSKEVSIPFSNGQVIGYFDNNIPEEFWSLYSIYLGMNVFSSVVWTKKVVPEKLDEMIDRLYCILEDHKYFENIKPSWYKEETY
ncbi:phosphotransferase [Bacillus sp. FJAT-49705]|uniref:Phosphotransferase n=1 Tax=Cytobacillus citreus TaxID=2833586 RepID=A0ABS5NXL9_9BACI|nr:phosphotransferase [Cytobacillus citreus]MBS4192113.1 phosphotransferase [Cytobacillus citreus]